jgi:hypothetical protein
MMRLSGQQCLFRLSRAAALISMIKVSFGTFGNDKKGRLQPLRVPFFNRSFQN